MHKIIMHAEAGHAQIMYNLAGDRVGIWGGANEATGAAIAEPGKFFIDTPAQCN
jgi:hypothetical protein